MQTSHKMQQYKTDNGRVLMQKFYIQLFILFKFWLGVSKHIKDFHSFDKNCGF